MKKLVEIYLQLKGQVNRAMTEYYTKIEQIEQLSKEEKKQLKPVGEKFEFRCNDYYLSLINFDDPDDPIRRLIIPDVSELDEWGRLDPSDEETYTIIPGLEHKYNSTVLLLVSNHCEGICRYCFRKRVFIKKDDQCLEDIDSAMNYIRDHNEITNVLLTGGDPLLEPTERLEKIISGLRQIDHVQIIRIGTKMPAFNPAKIIENLDLLKIVKRYSTEDKKIYFMTHFAHPRELTDLAVKAVNLLKDAGALIDNQNPLIKGVNDNPDDLAELLAKLSFIGAVPYYIFQCRPALGNRACTVPIEKGYDIIEKAKAQVSGLAKRARFVMSHSTGKIEIVGKANDRIYLKYHRAADDADSGLFMVMKSNPDAYWFDDYNEVIKSYPANRPYRSYGPE